ncbi:TetR family transcriptional regulator [Rhodococcus sp. 06-462-5]|uniref:TetR/AcrR family transcriptional regulator n=1 Tax=unclassified Rhodococcus (in: high G+C Gram-positive bacteria) TaxID=192944 RepID=UPI000B9A862F|nr:MULTISPECIES: TetR/AcrR family transcriptional regulator [unclassified Rhodococcus (in: high G+C Gram-positive bacteria)]OZC65139.1 TetR family transcriptional regulator [Rhodococcus sp. 06-462-5]OZE65233.1 TetR family transcriptional regulator [Rhodococcus sp. 02-925g]
MPEIETTDTREAIIACSQRLMARKGYTAVGLSEILAAVHVPKGSFYYHFASKDALGEAMLQSYFTDYLTDFDAILSRSDRTWAQRIEEYFESWIESQSSFDCQGKCLAVKLGAEVADLSESMRVALGDGITAITERIEKAVRGGADDGSMTVGGDPQQVAASLYDLWLGASVVAKLSRTTVPMDNALRLTQRLLGI